MKDLTALRRNRDTILARASIARREVTQVLSTFATLNFKAVDKDLLLESLYKIKGELSCVNSFLEQLDKLIENEKAIIDLISTKQAMQNNEGLTGASLKKMIEAKYGNVKKAIDALGLDMTLYTVLKGKQKPSERTKFVISEDLGVDISMYLDPRGRVYQGPSQ